MKITNRCIAPISLAAFFLFSPWTQALEIFVSPTGKKEAAGTAANPTTLRDAIAKTSQILKESGLPEKGLTITLQSGIYPYTEPFILNEEFKGTAQAPITIRAEAGGEVTFDGRADISHPEDFRPVTDPEERKRLAPKAADQIRVITLSDPALIHRLSEKMMLSLNYDDLGFLPAVFPNKGYAKLATTPVSEEISPPGVPRSAMNYGVRAAHKPYIEPGRQQGWMGSLAEPRGAQAAIEIGEESMAGSWLQWEYELKRDNTRNAMVGFYEAVWKLSSIPVYAVNAHRKTLHLSRTFAYGFGWLNKDRGGQPFRIFGLLPELDQPGEWFFDPKTRRLFVYPPKRITADSKIGLPVASGFITLNHTEHVRILGLNVRHAGAGTVYHLNGGQHNLIAGCTIHSSTARGLSIRGRHNGVSGCDLYDLDAHVSLNGLQTAHISTYENTDSRSVENGQLIPGGNYVINCHFYQKKFVHEKINISISGVGQIFKNNLVHNSIGQAMMVRGNDHRIERNEFFNIGYEEGDGGAIYSGNDLTGYGTVYRHNFFHHLMRTPGKHGRAGIHLDDFQSGATCIGNIFYKSCTMGIYMNGGAGNTLIGNVFLEGHTGAFNRGNWGRKAYMQYLDIQQNPSSKYAGIKEDYVGRAEKVVGKQGWNKSPWVEKYPLFQKVMNDDGEYGRLWPIYCTFKNNMYYGNVKNETVLAAYPDSVRKKTILENDIQLVPSDFVDYENLNLAFATCPQGIDPIPFSSIGLYLDEYRLSMPNKNHYRMAVKSFFSGDRSYEKNRPVKQFDSATLIETGPREVNR
ncbi:right-handed parallel beta-helix repeat-containing protein [Pontiella agarivorans]|uniref:Right-handed parallel beta-helix repeat-containing protein n=1 Tax=Pontiella agarivorans TaxID=3038953 RepID=A0ABU5MXH1_9BACT|nr:right-handed parallel beta-helix repeat-containing protein [Pontiella agarivorans]MDZ8118771.1 right-handed parallel beta-helix repeat-containing protein [Pontiella agarivorans]